MTRNDSSFEQPDDEAAPPTSQPPAGPSGPRTHAIVWGALILAFCAFIVQRSFAPGLIDSTGWIAATAVGIGLLLLIVGIVVVVRGRRR